MGWKKSMYSFLFVIFSSKWKSRFNLSSLIVYDQFIIYLQKMLGWNFQF